MSIDATRWAWGVQIQATRKIVLLSMADRASEDFECWPSIARLVYDTCLDRKTIMDAVSDLEKAGHIAVKRILGKGNCYQLLGAVPRETSTKNGTGTSTKNGTGTAPKTEPVPKTGLHQYQKRDTHQSQKRDTESTIESTKNQIPPYPPTGDERDAASPGNQENQTPLPQPSMAVAACVAMRSVGMASVNPSDPRLLALVKADGASIDTFAEAAREAVERGKGFAYALSIVENQLTGAQRLAEKITAQRSSKMSDILAGAI